MVDSMIVVDPDTGITLLFRKCKTCGTFPKVRDGRSTQWGRQVQGTCPNGNCIEHTLAAASYGELEKKWNGRHQPES